MDFYPFRQRETQKKLLSILGVLAHAALVAIFLHGFFGTYLPNYTAYEKSKNSLLPDSESLNSSLNLRMIVN